METTKRSRESGPLCSIVYSPCRQTMADKMRLQETSLGHMLLDLASQTKRVIRVVEAIPLHLTLDIVRLDDALGESWALPFQACPIWAVSTP